MTPWELVPDATWLGALSLFAFLALTSHCALTTRRRRRDLQRLTSELSAQHAERRRVEGELHGLREDFERTVLERTAELRTLNDVLKRAIVDAQRMDQGLRHSEERFRQLTENIPQVFYVLDLKTERVLYVSPAFKDIWGRSCTSLYAEPRVWLEAVHPEDRPRVAHRWAHCCDRGIFAEEYRVVRPDGTMKWIKDCTFPVRKDGRDAQRIVGIAEDITIRKETERALLESGDRLRALSHRLMQVQEIERSSLARDLHDEIGQALTALKLNLQAAQRARGAKHSRPLRESVALVTQILQQVRGLALDLKPPLLEDLGLVATLESLLTHQGRRAGWLTTFTAGPVQAGLPLDLATACFRVAQETLTNAARHAKAGTVAVSISQTDGELELLVRDDGVGFDIPTILRGPTAERTMGLIGMEERVRLFGGRLTITAAPGQGTEVRAAFPLPSRVAVAPSPATSTAR